MLYIILIIGIIAAVLTILIVLIQNPKGGGLASNFSAGNQLFGAKQTTEGVEKLTWIFVTVILLVSLVASSYNGGKKTGKGTETTTAAPAVDPAVNDALNAKQPKGVTAPTPIETPSAPQNGEQMQQQGDPNPPQAVPPPAPTK